MKTVFKEIIIILLLVLAILLVLGVFLYDYIPMNKVVPKIEQYETPDNIKKELQESIKDEQDEMTPIVYEINNSDLKQYEKTKDYDKGKVNPFADSTITNVIDENGSTDNTNTTNNATNNNSNSNNSSATNNTQNGSEGNYLPNKGTK